MTLAVLLASCGGSSGTSVPQSGGPLGPPDNHDRACLPAARPGQPETDGFAVFTNLGKVPLVITRVSLADPHQLALLGSWLVPTGGAVLGEWATFPPQPSVGFPLPPGWPRRQKPGHYRLRPGKQVNIAVGIEATARPGGTSSGVVVWYSAGAVSYVRRSNWAIQVSIPRCGAPTAG